MESGWAYDALNLRLGSSTVSGQKPKKSQMKSRIVCSGLCLLIKASVQLGAASFQGLGDLPGGTFGSAALAISADGLTVVGGSQSALGYESFRWRSSSGMIGLGD